MKIGKWLGGIGLGTVGVGLGRTAFILADSKLGVMPDPTKNPRLRQFISDSCIVAGALLGAIVGANLGQGRISADPKKAAS